VRQRVEVGQASTLLGLAQALQRLEDGDHVRRLAGADQPAHSRVDVAVLVAVEVPFAQKVRTFVPGQVVQQQASEHALLGLGGMRRHPQPGNLLIACAAT